MPLFKSVSLVTNLIKGYTLQQALKITADCGFSLVEIASIGGMCEHVLPDDITPDFIASLVEALKTANLSSYAFSGHVDLTLDGGLADFLKKMDLAAGIGCTLINTNSGPLERIDEFKRNIKKVIERAERLGLTVCLESHGDIVGDAKQAAPLFKEINHPLIRFNYDTGNTYFYSKGKTVIEDDILYALEYLAYLHVKDISIAGNRACYKPLGEGDVNLPGVFASLAQLGRPIDCGLEIPVFVEGTLDLLSSSAAPIPEERIRAVTGSSMDFLKRSGVLDNS